MEMNFKINIDVLQLHFPTHFCRFMCEVSRNLKILKLDNPGHSLCSRTQACKISRSCDNFSSRKSVIGTHTNTHPQTPHTQNFFYNFMYRFGSQNFSNFPLMAINQVFTLSLFRIFDHFVRNRLYFL